MGQGTVQLPATRAMPVVCVLLVGVLILFTISLLCSFVSLIFTCTGNVESALCTKVGAETYTPLSGELFRRFLV